MVLIISLLGGVAILGVILTIILISRITIFNNRLKEFKKFEKYLGFSDLLNYSSLVSDGVLLGKNGTLTCAWEYRGIDYALASENEISLLSRRLNSVFKTLGSGWLMHIDVVRSEAKSYLNNSHFPDPITQTIDDNRRKFFEKKENLFKTKFVLSLTYLPPILLKKKFFNLFLKDSEENLKVNTRSVVREFEQEVQKFENKISVFLKLHRLKSFKQDGVTKCALLSWVQYCVTSREQTLLLNKAPVFLDSVLGGVDFLGGISPKVGNKYIKIVAIENLPTESQPELFSKLDQLPFEYRWNTRYIFLDQQQALNAVNSFRKHWKQKSRGLLEMISSFGSGKINYYAHQMVEEADELLSSLESGELGCGYYTSVIILADENYTKVVNKATQVEQVLIELGFVSRVETVNTIEAYLGSLPSHGGRNVRKTLITTVNLADLMPNDTVWIGNYNSPCPLYPSKSPALAQVISDSGAPFWLNLHVNDVGHTLIFGPTGSGKSTLLAFLVTQFRRYKDISIFVFDKGMSMYPLTKALKGNHFNFLKDDCKARLSPCAFLNNDNDLLWFESWIIAILELNKLSLTSQDLSEIRQAIESFKEATHKSLSSFIGYVQSVKITETIQQYIHNEGMNNLIGGEVDELNLARLTTFETEALIELGENYLLPILLYLFRRIDKSLAGQPAVIILDEAWVMLQHPVFQKTIEEWLRTLRKKNCIVILATQSLADTKNSAIMDVVNSSTPTKIFLPNPEAKDSSIYSLYQAVGLTEKQINFIQTAIPKKQYFIKNENGQRLFDLALDEYTLAFVASSDKQSISAIKSLEEIYPESWTDEWVKIKKAKEAVND